jgi:ribonuclease P protein component
MSVSYRTVGNAVSRNRIRRMIRELFRLHQPTLPPLDFVVTSRPGARNAERPVMLTSLERLFAEAIRKAAPPPPQP